MDAITNLNQLEDSADTINRQDCKVQERETRMIERELRTMNTTRKLIRHKVKIKP